MPDEPTAPKMHFRLPKQATCALETKHDRNSAFGCDLPNHFLHIAIFLVRQRFHFDSVSCRVTPAGPKEPDISRGNRARRIRIDKMRSARSIAFPAEITVKSLRHRINAVVALSHVAPGAHVEDYPEISAQPALFASATECYRRNLRPRCANGFWQLRFRSDCAAGKNRRCRECANEKARQFASPHKDVSDCRLCLLRSH